MNKLSGKIKDIQSSDAISLVQVDVDGDIFSAMILEGNKSPARYKNNDHVALLFKETEVGLAKNLTGMISLRNRFKGNIEKIEKGPILAKITLKYKSHKVESIITSRSAEQMALREKEEVEWLVKSNEMTLMQDPA